MVDYYPENMDESGIIACEIDLNGDGADELVVFDHAQHRVTIAPPMICRSSAGRCLTMNNIPMVTVMKNYAPAPAYRRRGFDGDARQDLF